MAYKEIITDVADNILTITLNRPEKLNAFTGTMMHEMIDAFQTANKDDAIRCVIVTGAGRAFCAGADLSAGASTFDATQRSDRPERNAGPVDQVNWSDERVRDGGGRLTLEIFECLKPVIAAVNGPAVGIGVTMQLAMDIRIASEQARFGFVFSRRGIVPEAASSWFLPRARAIAKEIVDNTAPVSIALIRQMMWKGLGMDHPMEAHKVDSRGIYSRGASADVKEGVVSFLEKRPAKFPQKVSGDMPPYFPWWQPRKYS